MNNNSKSVVVARLAGLTVFACVACCVLPVGALWLSAVTVVGLSVYWPWVALIVLVVLAVFAIRRFRLKQRLSCDLDGPCSAKS